MLLRKLCLIVFAASSVGLLAQTVSPPLFDAFEYDDDGDGIVDEFDDRPADATFAFETHDPSRSRQGRIAFEVDWPRRGDDDFNDLVLAYSFVKIADASNEIVELLVRVEVIAVGTDTSVGAAVRLPVPDKATFKATLGRNGGTPVAVSPEPGTTETIFRLFDDAFETESAEAFFNTMPDQHWLQGERIELRVILTAPVPTSGLDPQPFDLFVFATKEPGREIHRPNRPPTELADPGLFGTFADTTDLLTGRSYLSDAGLPWVLDLPEPWSHPREGIDLARAYPRIVDWIESAGAAELDWFRHPEPNEVLP